MDYDSAECEVFLIFLAPASTTMVDTGNFLLSAMTWQGSCPTPWLS
jgi:hypothetical protein